MGILAWAMVGLALWHFTIWLPDRHWGGIVGSLIGAVIGAILIGLAIHGFSIPGRHNTHIITVIEGIPGALIGIAAIYIIGITRESALEAPSARA